MSNKYFEGWYYKQRSENYMLALIPGQAASGAFIQMIDSNGTKRFAVPRIQVSGDTVQAGDCLFSPTGIEVHLPDIEGSLRYSDLTPLRSDIMGPFAHLPMQCRHGVVSMHHTVNGCITVDGTPHIFSNGSGYAEKDRGRSFPRSYLWIQCNDFSEECAFMLSIAHIPFLGCSFTGCICALIYRGKEYRFATYRGVKIEANEEERVCLKQGKLRLELSFHPLTEGHPLAAPAQGEMTAIIRESCDAHLHLHLTQNGSTIVECESDRATFERR